MGHRSFNWIALVGIGLAGLIGVGAARAGLDARPRAPASDRAQPRDAHADRGRMLRYLQRPCSDDG